MNSLEYWPNDEILFINNIANTTFTSREAIDRAFDEVDRFWKANCNRRVYCVVDYTNLVIAPSLLDYWSERRTAAVGAYSLATVNFGADLAMRVALRGMAVRTHVPSNVCATIEEAIATARGMRDGTIPLTGAG